MLKPWKLIYLKYRLIIVSIMELWDKEEEEGSVTNIKNRIVRVFSRLKGSIKVKRRIILLSRICWAWKKSTQMRKGLKEITLLLHTLNRIRNLLLWLISRKCMQGLRIIRQRLSLFHFCHCLNLLCTKILLWICLRFQGWCQLGKRPASID
jgi:hypothetical protein